jgi:hypothetical protein
VLSAGVACSSDSSSKPSVDAPSGLNVIVASGGGGHLTWMDSDGESQYVIERKSGAEDWTTIGTVPFDTTQYHDGSAAPGATYVYRVAAIPEGGGADDGVYSSEVTLNVPAEGSAGAGGSTASGGAGGAAGSDTAGSGGAAGEGGAAGAVHHAAGTGGGGH